MARDYVTVANLATGFFGEDDQIRAPDEDSKPARTVKAVWEEIRKFVLAQGEWNFAMRRVLLTRRTVSAANPLINWDSAFPLPVECRRFVEILDPSHVRARYSLEADAYGRAEILADDLGPLMIRYVRDMPNPATWSDGFTEAFSMRLAWQIADRLSGDKLRKEQALKAYEVAMRKAKGTDAKQNPPRRHPETDWSAARRGVDGGTDLSTGWH